MSSLSGPVLLSKEHDVEQFDCGKPPLNGFLSRHALENQRNDSARTFVVLSEASVIGYYSLAASAVSHEEVPSRMGKGLARYPIPVVLMARFAVDLRFQGQGIGSALFKDAIKRALNLNREVALRAFVVHAKDDEARLFYERYGMTAFEENPFHLYFLMKDIEATLHIR